MLAKKASDIIMLDIRKLTSIADYFVICTAESDTQVKAIADAIQDEMEKEGVSLYHSEGLQALLWVILDYVDVVVHIFYREARSFYNLERIWSDAKVTVVAEDKEGKIVLKSQRTTKKKKDL